MKTKPLVSRNPVFRLLAALFYYGIAAPLLALVGHVVFGLRVRGRKNLRGLKGAVIVCNHVHPLDCSFVGILLLPRKLIFTSAEQIFSRKVVGPLLRLFGSVPVPASFSGMRRFIEELTEQARGGRAVCIYPEGELIPYCTELRAFRGGAFLIAAQAGVPVVPVVITQRRPAGLWRYLKRRPCLTVTAGRPIVPDAAAAPRKAAQKLAEAALCAMRALQETETTTEKAARHSA